MTTSSQWPTDEEICEIARDKGIPLFAEAYQIAQQYNRICEALSANQLAGDDLNWCGFAQWSSRAVAFELQLDTQSGSRKLSRRYYIPMVLQPLFRLAMMTFLGGSYGLGLSIANRSIFVEMASFHTNVLSGAAVPMILQVSPADFDTKPLLEDLGEEGRGLLRTAHKLLSNARSATGELRGELILGANIALSAYEQNRVQPALELVFYRPVRFILRVSWRMPYYFIRGRTRDRFKIYEAPHENQPQPVRSIEAWWVRMYSRNLSLKTAIDTISLGRPIVSPHGYSTPLLRNASTFMSEDVAALVRQYGPADPANLKGVSNWLGYKERMSFIVAYFMVYQKIEQMFHLPQLAPKRSRGKPHLLDPLGDLDIRKVTL